MKKILLSLLTLGFGAFTLNAQTLDQSNTAPVGSGWAVNSGAYTSNGQSFTAGMTGFLHSISINIDATNSSYPILAGDFTLTIRSGHGYGGTVLNIDTFTVTGSEASGWLNIPVKPNTVAITTGNSYTYIIDEISGTGQLNIVASNNAYAGGDLYYQVFTNPATIDGSRDFIFETYMQSSLTCNIADQTVTASQTTLCDSGAVTISTGSSETGYNYYLRDDADSSIVDGPIAGTGSGLTFNTGTINATTTYNVYAKEPKISAVDLANSNDFIRFNAPFTAFTSELTVEAWVQFNNNNFVRAGQSSAGVDNMATNVWLWEGGSFFVNNNGTWINLQFPAITTTGWMHVATVANSNGMFIYYDGVLVASNTTGITSGIQSNSSAVMELGHDPRFIPSSRNNDVVYDNFRVWSVARSASEIADNYQTCLTGSETGLVQYTQMNEATGNTLNSLQGDNGIITNGLANPWVLGSNVCDGACNLEMTQLITVTVNNSPTSSISSTNVSCNGGSDGSATVSPSGGTAPYTFLWSNAATTATATGLAAGNYNVTVTDANGCFTNVSNITITEPTALVSSISAQTNVSCNGGLDGSATATATGGTAPYNYLWSNFATPATVTGLAAGNYSVTITDANACTSVQNVTITEPNALTGSISSQTNVACNGGTNGSATVSPSGGTAPYTYLWSNAATTATATGLAAGIYNVTITDANGCTTNASNITITEPTALASSVASQTNVACNGASTGAATVTATGGTAPYTYLWSNAATTATATGLAAGIYNVTITDANGCTTNVSNITITEPTALTSSIASQTNVSCNGGTNGSATATATGGTAPYTYLWNNAATTATVTGLVAGNYSVTITDANTCTSVQNVTITEPTIITGTDVQTACNTYTWIDNNTYTASNNTATHTIVSGAANGCDSIVTLDLTITTVDNNTTLNVNTISANQNGATYQWLDCDNGNAVISGATAQNFTPTATGNYAVEVTLGTCVDTSACTNVIITSIGESIMENVNIFPNPTKDDIYVELPLNEFTSVEVKIYSVTGKLVYNASQNNVSKLSISTANWDKGLYFIQLISNNQTITEKIIKQ